MSPVAAPERPLMAARSAARPAPVMPGVWRPRWAGEQPKLAGPETALTRPGIIAHARADPRLPPLTPAWAEHGLVHLAPTFALASAREQARILRHEQVHSLHQQWAPGGADVAHAERLAEASSEGRRLPASELSRPAPALLAFPPQTYKPFNQVWIGHPGLILEVVASGVKVRLFQTYDELKLKGPQDYFCGTHDFKGSDQLAKRMAAAASVAAGLGGQLPAGATAQKVSFIAVSGKASSFRLDKDKGVILLNTADFMSDSYLDTISHESSHGIFEYHSLNQGKPAERKPDVLALRVADLFQRLSDTTTVPVPTGKFDARKPPATKPGPDDSPRPAGVVMVIDALWSGAGGHPWDGVDEFFASAYAGFQRNPTLLKASIDFYSKLDAKIAPLAKELLSLLAATKQPDAIKKLARPKEASAAEQTLGTVKAPLDLAEVWKEEGRLDWILDPTLMPAPEKIYCPTNKPAKSSPTVDELLEFEK